MNKKTILLTSVMTVAAMHTSLAQKPWTVYSPDHHIAVGLSNTANGLFYNVKYDNAVVIKPSLINVKTTDADLGQGLIYKQSNVKRIDDHYTLTIGKRKVNNVSANELVVIFKGKANTTIEVDLRAYNDGAAFRYRFPQKGKKITVTADQSQFALPEGKFWAEPYDKPSSYGPAYEGIFADGVPTGTDAKDEGGWAFPALFKTADNWVLVTESGLDDRFFGSHLNQNCKDGVYTLAGPQAGEGLGLGSVNAEADGPFASPWRTIIIGKKLGTIVESNLVYHLSAPSRLKEVSWIKPGRASWSWWSDHKSSRDFQALKKYVDLAQVMHWEYSLVDANWNVMGNGGTIEDLVKYAEQKGVGLVLWYNSGGPHNNVSEQPRDIMSDPVKRKAEFAKLHKWGVKGVKVDFWQSDKQDVIKQYYDLLADAANEHILVDFHGCTLPRGWSRTYPNLMTMEAVRGAENYGWSNDFAKDAPSQNNILTYTRNVIGPMDYTPVTFTDYDCCPHTTTDAHELALTVMFESGLFHFADRASAYLDADSHVKAYMSKVPATWDDTQFIQGEPGKETVLARRSGNIWYVAGINGQTTEKVITLNLPFLKIGKYTVDIYEDGKTSREISYQKSVLNGKFSPTVKLLGNGGFVAVISPSNQIDNAKRHL